MWECSKDVPLKDPRVRPATWARPTRPSRPTRWKGCRPRARVRHATRKISTSQGALQSDQTCIQDHHQGPRSSSTGRRLRLRSSSTGRRLSPSCSTGPALHPQDPSTRSVMSAGEEFPHQVDHRSLCLLVACPKNQNQSFSLLLIRFYQEQ